MSDSAYLLSRGLLMAKAKAESRDSRPICLEQSHFKCYSAPGAASSWQHRFDRVTCRVRRYSCICWVRRDG